MTRRAIVAAILLASLVVVGAPGAAPPAISASCSPGSSDCSAWHTADVTVTWTVVGAANSCPAVTVSSDTGGTPVSCSSSNADGAATVSVNVRKDATGPSIDASASRAPDNDGWYRSPVSFSASGSDALSGLAGCSGASYNGPDTNADAVFVGCQDNAGNSSSRSFEVKYDATAPNVDAANFDRSPDNGGWYTKPVTVTFAGSDATSGIRSCTSARYEGPDGEAVSVSGTCTDRAGNTSAAKVAGLRYDATAPTIKAITVKKGNRALTVRWNVAGGAASYELLRGVGKAAPASVYKGTATAFTDRAVRNGVKYVYTLVAVDPAGNAARATSNARPRPQLYRPPSGARISAPFTFAWEKVPKATYYNFQLHRRVGGRWVKVLTTWPARPWLRLARTWNVGGFSDRLSPGRYRWYVWPGYRSRAERSYGKLLGSSEFSVG